MALDAASKFSCGCRRFRRIDRRPGRNQTEGVAEEEGGLNAACCDVLQYSTCCLDRV